MSDRLFDRINAAGRLPTPPGVVLKLLEMTRRDDVSANQIADTLAQDPAMAAKILRFANSPIAGIPREVTSLQQAVTLVGVRGVKMMALSFAILGNDKASKCTGFDQRQFGIQSVGCGVAARVLATASKTAQAQDAFMAGLLSQIGRTVLATGVPDEYANVLADAQQIPRDLDRLERKQLGESYPRIGAQLLRSWRIPDALCAAVESFHACADGQAILPLAKLLCVGEAAAEIICPDTKTEQPDSQVFVALAKEHLGIDDARCAELLGEIARDIESARVAFDIPPGKTRDPEDIQAEVRERIAELSLAMHVENRTMAQQQEDLMRRATTDALTGIGNRAAFDSRFSLELQRSLRSGTPLAMMMMDVDRFKVFNDTHGHQAGDRVLQTVARVLDANVRKVDYVARYGGEEFAVIGPDASLEGARILADRLRQAVEDTKVPWEGRELSVTLSIGVALITDVRDADEVPIIRAADAQLYIAKKAGRNRVSMVVNGSPLTRVASHV